MMQSETALVLLPAAAAGVFAPMAVFTGSPLFLVGAVSAPAAALAGSRLGKTASGKFEGYALKAARAGMKRQSSYELAEKISSMFGASIAAVAAVLAVVILSLLTDSFTPFLLLGLGPAAAPMLATFFSASNAASSRKTTLSIEYPFFMVFSSIVAYTGGTIYMALQHAKKAVDVFRQISREAGEVERKAILAGVGVVKGIEAHAETIPHEEFSRALLTTTSVWRTGGNLVATLEDVGSSRVDLQACKLEYSIVSPK